MSNFGSNDDFLTGFMINISRSAIHNTRSIYNLLDLLGDIGGLTGILQLIAGGILYCISYIFGSDLDKYLCSSLFTTRPPFMKQESELQDRRSKVEFAIKSIASKKPLTLPWNAWMICKRKNIKSLKKGMTRVDKELDFVKFIKRVHILESGLKIVFTKLERYLLKNQRNFSLH